MFRATCSIVIKCFSFANTMAVPHLLQGSSSFAFTQATGLLVSWPHSGQGMPISSLSNMAALRLSANCSTTYFEAQCLLSD